MSPKWSQFTDVRLRRDAISWLNLRTNGGEHPLSREEINDFFFDGQPFRLLDQMKGIRKPKELDTSIAIMTSYRKPGEERPYADDVGSDGLPRYMWEGTDPTASTNHGLRLAYQRKLPIIWFIGVGGSPMKYHVVCPVYIVGEEAEQNRFVLSPANDQGLLFGGQQDPSIAETIIKEYLRQETNIRLHQPVFRASVIRAYNGRCAICNLGHERLLDAAHIIPDSDERGIASVTNGIALCKIHHAAYDSSFLGISPDYIVEIRRDLLEELDGPMLEHGLKERHNQKLMIIPHNSRERPDRELLDVTYQKFLLAQSA